MGAGGQLQRVGYRGKCRRVGLSGTLAVKVEQAELQRNEGQEEAEGRSRCRYWRGEAASAGRPLGWIEELDTKEESSDHSGGKGAGGAKAGRTGEQKEGRRGSFCPVKSEEWFLGGEEGRKSRA